MNAGDAVHDDPALNANGLPTGRVDAVREPLSPVEAAIAFAIREAIRLHRDQLASAASTHNMRIVDGVEDHSR